MIAVVDYGEKNIETIAEALDSLNEKYIVTNKELEILKSDKIILPGEGGIEFTIKQLHKNNLFTMLRVCRKPILGINTGMQVFGGSVKGLNMSGLGILNVPVEKFDSENSEIPFTGFKSISINSSSKILKGINPEDKFYFKNSYFIPVNEYSSSVSENKISFSASVEKDNYYGVQFLPEKSGEPGKLLLKNFIEI